MLPSLSLYPWPPLNLFAPGGSPLPLPPAAACGSAALSLSFCSLKRSSAADSLLLPACPTPAVTTKNAAPATFCAASTRKVAPFSSAPALERHTEQQEAAAAWCPRSVSRSSVLAWAHYMLVQFAGGIAGAIIAHLMFGLRGILCLRTPDMGGALGSKRVRGAVRTFAGDLGMLAITFRSGALCCCELYHCRLRVHSINLFRKPRSHNRALVV